MYKKQGDAMASIYKRITKAGQTVYYGAFRVNGRLIRRKLGLSLNIARKALKQIEYELTFNNPVNTPDPVKISIGMLEYLKVYESSGVKYDQVYQTKLKLNKFNDYCSKMGVTYLCDINVKLAKEYIVNRSNSVVTKKYKSNIDNYECKIAPATINKEIRILKKVFNFYIELEWIVTNPFQTIKLLKEHSKSERYHFSSQEIEHIMNNAGNHFDFYSLLHYTGLRATDAFKLSLNNIKDGYLNIQMNKTGDWLVNIPIPAGLVGILNSRIKAAKRFNTILFTEYVTNRERRGVVQHLQSMFSIEKVRKCNINLHTFRHTYAHNMLNLGVPKEVLQTLLGHRSVKTTEIYANWVKKDDLLKWVEMIDKKNKT